MYKKNSRQTTNLHDGVYVLDHGRASCTCLNSFYYEVIPGGSMPRDLGRKKQAAEMYKKKLQTNYKLT